MTAFLQTIYSLAMDREETLIRIGSFITGLIFWSLYITREILIYNGLFSSFQLENIDEII
jgi:hypothetical protein